MKPPDTTMGQRISAFRTAGKMSQSELADALRISQTYLSLLEGDRKKPSETLLELIIYRFDIQRDWLYHGEGSPTLSENEPPSPKKKLSKRERFERDALITACAIGPILPMVSGTIAVGVCTSHILSKMCKAYGVHNAAGLAKKLDVDRSTIKTWVEKDNVPGKYLNKSFDETTLSPEDIKESQELLIINKNTLTQNVKNFLEQSFKLTIEEKDLNAVIENSKQCA